MTEKLSAGERKLVAEMFTEEGDTPQQALAKAWPWILGTRIIRREELKKEPMPIPAQEAIECLTEAVYFYKEEDNPQGSNRPLIDECLNAIRGLEQMWPGED